MPSSPDTNLLLLSSDRAAQLTAALATSGYATPLATLMDEAGAYVDLATTGFAIPTNVRNSWVRTIAIYNAYVVAETTVPTDLKDAYDGVKAEVDAIAQGKRPGYPHADDSNPDTVSPERAAYGSTTRVRFSGDPT